MKTINQTVVLLAIAVISIMASCMPSTRAPFATLSPVITATPVAYKSDTGDIGLTILGVFEENVKCKSYNAMNAEQDALEFFDPTGQIDFDMILVHEIADSAQNK